MWALVWALVWTLAEATENDLIEGLQFWVRVWWVGANSASRSVVLANECLVLVPGLL